MGKEGGGVWLHKVTTLYQNFLRKIDPLCFLYHKFQYRFFFQQLQRSSKFSTQIQFLVPKGYLIITKMKTKLTKRVISNYEKGSLFRGVFFTKIKVNSPLPQSKIEQSKSVATCFLNDMWLLWCQVKRRWPHVKHDFCKEHVNECNIPCRTM